jgi:hypothetical protein
MKLLWLLLQSIRNCLSNLAELRKFDKRCYLLLRTTDRPGAARNKKSKLASQGLRNSYSLVRLLSLSLLLSLLGLAWLSSGYKGR